MLQPPHETTAGVPIALLQRIIEWQLVQEEEALLQLAAALRRRQGVAPDPKLPVRLRRVFTRARVHLVVMGHAPDAERQIRAWIADLGADLGGCPKCGGVYTHEGATRMVFDPDCADEQSYNCPHCGELLVWRGQE
jgi:hypothetical protein